MIDHRHRHAPFDELRKVMVVGHAERRPHDQAIHAAIEQPVDLFQAVAFFFFKMRHVAEVADPDGDRQVIALGQRVVNAGKHAHPKRVERRDHHADRLRAAGLHAVDEQISPPTKLARSLQHAAASFFAEAIADRRAECEAAASETFAAFATSFSRGT